MIISSQVFVKNKNKTGWIKFRMQITFDSYPLSKCHGDPVHLDTRTHNPSSVPCKNTDDYIPHCSERKDSTSVAYWNEIRNERIPSEKQPHLGSRAPKRGVFKLHQIRKKHATDLTTVRITNSHSRSFKLHRIEQVDAKSHKQTPPKKRKKIGSTLVCWFCLKNKANNWEAFHLLYFHPWSSQMLSTFCRCISTFFNTERIIQFLCPD